MARSWDSRGARHDDSALEIYFDNFPDVGQVFFEDSCHFDVIVSDGSGSLENVLDLALRGFGMVIADFHEGLFHSRFMASMRLKGSSISYGLLASRSVWRVSAYVKCLASQWGIGLWYLGIRRLVVRLMVTGAWSLPNLTSALVTRMGRVGFDFEVYGLPWRTDE